MAKIYDPITKEWVPVTNANGVAIRDVSESFQGAKNVEEALQYVAGDLAKKDNNINEILNTLSEQTEKIDWLMINGGGGGGTGSGGSSAPTLTSRIVESSFIVDKGADVILPLYFTSPNLGDGVLIVTVDDRDWDSYPIKQGSNNVNIGALPKLSNKVTVYAKDRVGLMSNPIEWEVICGGIDLTLDFDYNVDYNVGSNIYMPFNIYSPTKDPVTLVMNINGEERRIPCVQGYNEYIFEDLNVGIHRITLQATDGTFSSAKITFNLVVLNSDSLYLSTTFQNGSEIEYGVPVIIDYRISNPTDEIMTVNQYLDGDLYKTLEAKRGVYSWTLNNLEIKESYNYRIEVVTSTGERREVSGTFSIIQGDYTPVQVNTQGLVYRLDASTRTNQDLDKENPVYEGIQTTLHGFNFSSDGWVDGVLKCNASSYVEIDYSPWGENAPNGSTIEIVFKTNNIGEDKAKIFNYTDTLTNKGAYVSFDEAKIGSVANASKVFLNADEWTTISFVLDRKNKFAKIFTNGICTRAFALSDSGTGVDTALEDFVVSNKMYLNCDNNHEYGGSTEIKDFRVYRRALTDDEIVNNLIAQERDIIKQKTLYDFNFENKTLPTIRMYGDTTNMTLENAVPMRVKYISPNTEKYGQPFDLPYCEVYWQGTSSLDYVLKNYNIRLKDENNADAYYTPYPNGVKENLFCLKADYMESSHSRNVGIAKFVENCMYDTKNPAQLKDSKVRNCIEGFPILLYINDELQGVYNFNTDRYSVATYGYTDPDKHLVYEISANSDTTAGAFFKWSPESGKSEIDYYKADFRSIYPSTRVAGNDNFAEIKRLVEWVNDASDEDFRDNLDQYFNREYLLRYYIFAMMFGAVDSLGKNMKLASWDGRIWYPQVYDADTSIGLDNTGFLKFDMDIEVGDEGVYNTTSSQLWSKVKLLLWNEIKSEYARMRNDRFTLDNVFKYIVDEQMSKIPATYYNRDMQTKYLNFGSSYLYALHGKGEQQIKYWLQGRLIYLDTLLGYNVSTSDYVTVRSSKLGEVYLDIQTFTPMYLTVKWRNTQDNSADQILRIRKGETVRFSFNMPTATDQEIRIFGGKYLKSVGDLSNLQPTTVLLAKAPNITELVCHSPNLINTDLSECVNLRRVDLRDCTELGGEMASQSTIDVSRCTNIDYVNCQNTKITGVIINPNGSNIREVWCPRNVQELIINKCYNLTTVGLEEGHNCKKLKLTDCPNVQHFGDREYDPIKDTYKYDNSKWLTGLQDIEINNSCYSFTDWKMDECEGLTGITLINMPHIASMVLGVTSKIPLTITQYSQFKEYYTEEYIKGKDDISIVTVNCPKLKDLTITSHHRLSTVVPTNVQNALESLYCFEANTFDISNTDFENVKFLCASDIYKFKVPPTLKSLIVDSYYDIADSITFENRYVGLQNFWTSNANYLCSSLCGVEPNASQTAYTHLLNAGTVNKGFPSACQGSTIWKMWCPQNCEEPENVTEVGEADTINTLAYTWDLQGLEFEDFYLSRLNKRILGKSYVNGTTNTSYVAISHKNPSYKIQIRNLDFVAKDKPLISDPTVIYMEEPYINARIDYSNLTDNKYWSYAFTGFNNNQVDLTIPEDLSNSANEIIVEGTFYNFTDTNIEWKHPFVKKIIDASKGLPVTTYGTNLKEQEDYETDGIDIYWDKPGIHASSEINPVHKSFIEGTFINKLWYSNLKYIKNVELPNTTNSHALFGINNNVGTGNEYSIVKVGRVYAPKLTTGTSMFCSLCSLEEIGIVEVSQDREKPTNLTDFLCNIYAINKENFSLKKVKIKGFCNNFTYGLRYTKDIQIDFSEFEFVEGSNLPNSFQEVVTTYPIKLKGSVSNLSSAFQKSRLSTLDLSELTIEPISNSSNLHYTFAELNVENLLLKGDIPLDNSVSNFTFHKCNIQNVNMPIKIVGNHVGEMNSFISGGVLNGTFDLSELDMANVTNFSSTFSNSNIENLILNETISDNVSASSMQDMFKGFSGNCTNTFEYIPKGITNTSYMFHKCTGSFDRLPTFKENSITNNITSMYTEYTGSPTVPTPFVVPPKVTSLLNIFRSSTSMPNDFTLDCSKMEYILKASGNVDTMIYVSKIDHFTFVAPPYVYKSNVGTEADDTLSSMLYNLNLEPIQSLTFDLSHYKGTNLGTKNMLGNTRHNDIVLNNIDFNRMDVGFATRLAPSSYTIADKATTRNVDLINWRLSKEEMDRFIDEALGEVTPLNLFKFLKKGSLGETTDDYLVIDLSETGVSNFLWEEYKMVLGSKFASTEVSIKERVVGWKHTLPLDSSGTCTFKTANYSGDGITAIRFKVSTLPTDLVDKSSIDETLENVKSYLVTHSNNTYLRTTKDINTPLPYFRYNYIANFNQTITYTTEEREELILKANAKGWSVTNTGYNG